MSSVFPRSRENPKQATRVRSSKYQIWCDTGPDSIRPAMVILMPRCRTGAPDKSIFFLLPETFFPPHFVLILTDFDRFTA